MSSSGHNRGATAPRSVLWRNNNKAIEDGEETPIYAHSFPVAGSTPIFMRRIETIRDLSSILGAEANTRLRALLQSSELFSVLNEFEFLGRSNTLTFLSSYATFDSANKKGALENAILKSGVASFASELNAERLEQGRFYTEARKMTALQRFTAKAQLIASLPSALGYEQRDTDSTTALLGELVALAPKLEASGNVHLRGGAPGDSGKRGKGAAAGTDKAGADPHRPTRFTNMINSQHRSITRGGWGSWLLCRCSAQERREEREQRSAWAPRAGHVDVRHSILMAVDRRAPRSCRPVQQPNETRHSDDFSPGTASRPHPERLPAPARRRSAKS